MRNEEDENMISEFIQNIDKSQLARHLQAYVKTGNSDLFQERKSEQEYKQDIINLLKERKRNGL